MIDSIVLSLQFLPHALKMFSQIWSVWWTHTQLSCFQEDVIPIRRCSLDWCLVGTGFPARSMKNGPFYHLNLVLLHLIGISWWKFSYVFKSLLNIKNTTSCTYADSVGRRFMGEWNLSAVHLLCQFWNNLTSTQPLSSHKGSICWPFFSCCRRLNSVAF